MHDEELVSSLLAVPSLPGPSPRATSSPVLPRRDRCGRCLPQAGWPPAPLRPPPSRRHLPSRCSASADSRAAARRSPTFSTSSRRPHWRPCPSRRNSGGASAVHAAYRLPRFRLKPAGCRHAPRGARPPRHPPDRRRGRYRVPQDLRPGLTRSASPTLRFLSLGDPSPGHSLEGSPVESDLSGFGPGYDDRNADDGMGPGSGGGGGGGGE
ncbi:hypothetical protein DMC30DRAFT_404823 [Rhodotorula diobovata]|uniref:Uncharacterized protein n=1 Tax=Rhodotorula diobovata TaxID=5288 RepID=A0A5C5FNM6_9BASI|nr:hypothetical protein DMC30DRAFT_404823 [Rhodotorula diobovata]